MAKKRTSLDTLFVSDIEPEIKEEQVTETKKTSTQESKTANINKPKAAEVIESENKIVKQTVYLPYHVHEQLRLLAFEERKKMHDYLVEGLDRVFRNRGLKSYRELTNANQ